MGRPSLGIKLTMIKLAPEVMARIEVIAGKNRRSQFVREAVDAELARREFATLRQCHCNPDAGWPVKLSPEVISACVGGGVTSEQIERIYALIRAAARSKTKK